MSRSPCVKDEESGIWYGNNGASRDAYAVRWCSGQGYFGKSNRWYDCGNWRFNWDCADKRGSDWGACYRDEESRNAGFANRVDQGNQECKNKGYMGYDGGWKDCGSYYYSHHCGNPEWDGDFHNDGCQADGTHRFARKVNTKNFDWNAAADWLIERDIKPSFGSRINRITKEINNGIWVICYMNDNDCFVYNEGVNDNGCDIVNNKHNWAQKCNNWPNGWIASQDVINACQKKAPVGSTVKIDGSQVWAHWTTNDNCSYSNNKFIFNGSDNKQCILSGTNKGKTRHSVACNNWPIGWIASNDIVKLCNNTP